MSVYCNVAVHIKLFREGLSLFECVISNNTHLYIKEKEYFDNPLEILVLLEW